MNSRLLRSGARALGVVLAFTFSSHGAETGAEPLALTGDTWAHDPSTILRENKRYYLFSTGRGILTKSSPDLVDWMKGPSIFERPPSWTTNAVPGYRGHTWAPDVILLNGQYYLYYSVSTFGQQISAIGLATGPTLDPSSTNWRWTDQGPVIQSAQGAPFNAIDPSVLLDAEDQLWMAFGSFWQGIFLVELDSKTGLRRDPAATPRRLAWAESIEAPCLVRRGTDYYLFVNWGRCCRGTNSTYQVRVGRSQNVTGPYLDREGKDLADGGGTLFLESAGRFIGPGHIGLLAAGGTNWVSYHYYDAESNGRSRLAVGHLFWTEDGWPVSRASQQAAE